VAHYFEFGDDHQLVGEDLLRPGAWDALRLKTDGPFGLASTRAQLEAQADASPELETRARKLDQWLAADGARRVVSYGAGAGVLELWLERLDPSRELVLTDFAPATVEGLARLFPDREVRRHDLLADEPAAGDLALFHRIDTELSNRQWHAAYERFSDERVVVVATELMDLRRATNWTLQRLRRRLRGHPATRCGWIRTPGAYRALWRQTHTATPLALDLPAWILNPRER